MRGFGGNDHDMLPALGTENLFTRGTSETIAADFSCIGRIEHMTAMGTFHFFIHELERLKKKHATDANPSHV